MSKLPDLPPDLPYGDLIIAAQMRICYIETGTATYRAVDAEAVNRSLKDCTVASRGSPSAPSWQLPNPLRVQVKSLDRVQRDLISSLEDSITKMRELEAQQKQLNKWSGKAS